MHATLLRATLFSTMLLAACAGTTTTAIDDQFAPAPMGEFATPSPAPVMCTLTHAVPIKHTWFDDEGNEWEAHLHVHCESDTAHEELARACLHAHWPQAVERCCAVLTAAGNASTEEILDHLNEHLVKELNATLFPCELQDPVGKVTGIEWKSVTMRRRGHGVRHQIVQPKK